MKKFLALSLIGSSLLIGSNPAKADYDVFGYQYSGSSTTGNYIYGINTSTGARTLLTTRRFSDNSINGQPYISTNTGEIVFNTGTGSDKYEAYNWETNTWRFVTIQDPTETVQGDLNMVQRPTAAGGPSDGSIVLSNDGDNELIRVKDNEITAGGDSSATLIKKNTDGTIQLGTDTNDIDVVADGLNIDGAAVITKNTDGSIQLGADGNDIDVVADGLNIDGTAVITKNADGTIQIGTDENDIDITSEGLAIDGEPLITKKANGELHIGKNSWITKEENGRQKVYAKDAAGNPIPIDYTNGTKLLINGRDVEQSINNVGALSAALTGLPTVPTDTTLACGLGTGTHGGDFAFSGGCASKVNDKLSINYAASMTMPGQDYAGDFEDTFSARAGFVWKLGKATKPTQISMKDKKVMETKIESLEKKNKAILSKNQKLENKLSILMARLEKIEKIALVESKSKNLAVYKHK